MPQFGALSMIWVGGWSDEEAERAIAAAAQLGYDVIDIPLFNTDVSGTPSVIDAARTRTLLSKYNIAAAGCFDLDPETDIASSDAAIVKKGAAMLQKALSVTVAVGAEFFGGVVYSALNKYMHGPDRRGRANSVAVIRELACEAQKSGVNIHLEPVNRYESNLLNTCAQTLRYIDDVGEPNVLVQLDTFHMNIEEADSSNAIRQCKDRLGYFQINESHRGYVGTGTIQFSPMFRALHDIGFDKTISFEAFSSSVTKEPLSGVAAIWRNLWSDSDDIAAHAIGFMRSGYEDARRAAAALHS